MAKSPPYNSLVYYTFGTSNGLKPAIVLEELGLEYKLEIIDITKNTQKEDWYLKINPNRRIPALKDGNLRIFESGAIMLYLTNYYDPEYKLSYLKDTESHYEMLSWLMWQMGGLGPTQGQANHFRAMAGVYSAYSIQRFMDEAKRLFNVMESQLARSRWLAGDRYTIADIASFSWVRFAPKVLDFSLDSWPHLAEWTKTIESRPAVQRAINVPPSPKTTQEWDAVFKSARERVDSMKNTEEHDS